MCACLICSFYHLVVMMVAYIYNRERNEVTLKVYSKAPFLFNYLISSNRFKHMKTMSILHATVVWLHSLCSRVVMMDGNAATPLTLL